jgi:hypothetical protein
MATWRLGFVESWVKYMEICRFIFGGGKIYLKHNSDFRLRQNDELPATMFVALYTSKTYYFVFYHTCYNYTVKTVLSRIRRGGNSTSFILIPIC